MFDEDDYYSDEEELVIHTNKIVSSKVLVPSSASDFNHLTADGESLLKIMKDRGFDVTENQMKKMKVNHQSKQKETAKPKQKAGFFDGGASASLEELMKALNKAYSKADPQQASCILSYILEKKNLTNEDRNKFGIMKCKILFGLGAYKDCKQKAQELLKKTQNKLSAAILSNYLAKSKAEINLILSGYIDFLRSKSLLLEWKDSPQMLKQDKEQKEQKNKGQDFADSEIDTVARQIDHTEMQYNIKMNKYKNSSNLVHPYYPQFRHRIIRQVVCGDYHALFLVGAAINKEEDEGICANEIFGLGENTVGQINGIPSNIIFKEPILIGQLSGKKVSGIWACRQSSLAYDEAGNIYEWGNKQIRDDKISLSYTVGEEIQHFEKGYQHFALLTKSGKFYVWGTISFKGSVIFKQSKPQSQPSQNIIKFSCGNSCVIAIDDRGDCFGFGSNELGQLGIEGQLCAKSFKKLNNSMMGALQKVVCLNDATFFVNTQNEVFLCGRISYNRECIERPRQGEFSGELNHIISISGTLGNYYITNEVGQLYRWEVDSSVKFKIDRQNQKIAQRYVSTLRGNTFRVRSMISPHLTKVNKKTIDAKSYEEIQFQLDLWDELGPFGNNFVIAPKCQIFLSTYPIKKQDLVKQNQLFLDSFQFANTENKILLNQIVQTRLNTYKIQRNQQKPWKFNLSIVSEESGRFYFYILIQDCIVYDKELKIQVSERQKQLSEKNRLEKQMKEEERRRKAEMERQRLLDQKLRKENQQEQRRKETQRRAQQAFKKHMREQQQQKARAQEQRKARKQLLTGGGYDLNKLKARNQSARMEQVSQKLPEKMDKISEKMDKSSQFVKTGESFLPDINLRPSSKRKINLPTKHSLTNTGFDSVKLQKPKLDDMGVSITSGLGLFKTQSQKQKEKETNKGIGKGGDSLSKTGMGTKQTILKRGLSKGKK